MVLAKNDSEAWWVDVWSGGGVGGCVGGVGLVLVGWWTFGSRGWVELAEIEGGRSWRKSQGLAVVLAFYAPCWRAAGKGRSGERQGLAEMAGLALSNSGGGVLLCM